MNPFSYFIITVLPLIYFEKLIFLSNPISITSRLIIGLHSIVAATYLFILLVKEISLRKKFLKALTVLTPLIIYISGISFASIWSIDPKSSFVRLGHPLIGLLYAVITYLFFTKKNVINPIKTFAILAVATSSVSLILLFSRNNLTYISIPFLNDFYQLYFNYYLTEKKVIPTFTSLIIVFPLVYIFRRWSKTRHIATSGFMLITLSYILYASRVNFIVYVLGISALFWFVPASRNFLKRIVIVLIFLIVAHAAYSAVLQQPNIVIRLLLVRNIDKKTAISRINYAMKSFNIFKNNPIVGVGYGNYGVVSMLENDGPLLIVDPHNIFFLHLVETGIIGTLGLLYMYGTFIIRDYKFVSLSLRTWRRIDTIPAILLISSWSYMLINLAEPSLHSRLVIFFILRAMLVISSDVSSQSVKKSRVSSIN